MKKKILALCMGLTITMAAHAQLTEYYIGSAKNEIATVIRTLPDSSNIIGGYIYAQPNATDADIFMLRVSASGTIMWQKQWGTPRFDRLEDMIIADNGDIVAVGIADRDPSNVYLNNNGFIIRVSQASGALLFQNFVRDAANTTGGEALFSVCELDNHNLVAVGSHDLRPGFVDGMACVFNTSLGLTNTDVLPVPYVTDEFRGVVAWGNRVFISGFQDATTGGSLHDVRLLEYIPPVGIGPGTIVWSREYAYSVLAVQQPKLFTNNHFALKLQLINNRLVVNTSQIDPWNTTTAHSKHAILRTDLNGLTPDVHINDYWTTPTWIAANNVAFYALTDDHIYLAEDPAAALYDPVNPTLAIGVHPLFSDYGSMNTSSLDYSRIFTPRGNQTIFDIVGTPNGGSRYRLNMAGSAFDDSTTFGGNDIFWVTADSTDFDTTTQNCKTVYTPTLSTSPVTVTTSSNIVDVVNADLPDNFVETDPHFDIKDACKGDNQGCFDNASLVLSSSPDPNGCNITATANVSSSKTIAGYKWEVTTITGTTTTKDATNALSDNISFSLGAANMAIVKVTIYAVDMDNNQCCDTTLVDSITCNQLPPCEIYNPALTVTPLASDSVRNCCFTASVSATASPGYAIVGYAWTYPPLPPTYPGTGAGNPFSFCIPSNTPVTPGNLQVIVTAADAAGHQCSITLTHDIGCTQGIPSAKHANTGNDNTGAVNTKVEGIKIYPNPTKNSIFITSSAENITNVQVIDIAGRVLQNRTFEGNKNAEISLAGYATGSYTIKVNGQTAQIINKIN